MRLDYCALWIDDQPRHVKGFRERIETHLEERGFSLSVIPAETLEQADALLAQQENMEGIDLVLVDYDLGPGDGGVDVLRMVRDKFPYKDIMFYSAADTGKLRDLAHGANIDGIHFSTRLSLANDAISLIDKTLKKVMDIDHMRGVVMAATSDIDFIVEKSIVAAHNRLNEGDREAHAANVSENLRTKLRKWHEDLDKASPKGLSAILKLKHICTAADRLELLVEQLEKMAESPSKELDKAKIYKTDVVPRRNKLAHLAFKTENGSRILVGTGEKVDASEMTKLRCDLLDHRSNFEYIGVILDVKEL